MDSAGPIIAAGIIGAALIVAAGLGSVAAVASVTTRFEERLFHGWQTAGPIGGNLGGGQTKPRDETGSPIEGKSAEAV